MRDTGGASWKALPLVRGPERQALCLSDGATLVADVWRPETEQPLPVLLMRQPYGRAIASTVTLAHPAWYASHGYVVVVQDVRGTGGSEGDFDALVNEAADSAETIDWARGLEGSNGLVGTYGFSYQGTTQFLALAGGARPDAMAIAMASWSPKMDWLSEGGLFRAADATGWAVQMARLKARRMGDMDALQRLGRECHWQEHFNFLISRPDLSHLSRWARCEPGADPAAALTPPPPIPLLQTAGTADFFLRGTLAADAAFRSVSPASTHLILAPWGHIGWNRTSGPARLGQGSEYSVDRAQLAFFDHYLKGTGPSPAEVTAYDAGTDAWDAMDAAAFHSASSKTYYLGSGGLAAQLLTDGRLTTERPEQTIDWLVFDPRRPAPLCGGHAGTPCGPVDLSAVHDRTDVACFTTDPLAAPMRLCNRIEVEVSLLADGPHPALAATLSVIDKVGEATALSTSLTFLRTGTCRFLFEGLFRTLQPGQALRLSIQAAPVPEFHPYPALTLTDPGVLATTIAIDHRDSRLLLFTADQEPSNA